MSADPFDDVLNLEDQYYDQGYKQGYEDGFQAGKIEGRSVGLKTGYEKFVEAGRLQGKAMIWANRLPSLQKTSNTTNELGDAPAESQSKTLETGPKEQTVKSKLPPLNENPRLEKNVTSLYVLVEPGTLSTENDDEAVNDFDDRVKRAQGKLKIVERMTGEDRERDCSNGSLRPARNEI
ncbi:hypothetical protein BJ170DRAFT_213204 [Xylariales sp. AK1849]|nr:hypothetical protein BJ170DRAFT_213204 [Xylariales sp. AK1849]